MYQTNSNLSPETKLTVNLRELAELLGMGKITADKIGERAGAVVRIGRLKRYNLQKVRAYIDSISDTGSTAAED